MFPSPIRCRKAAFDAARTWVMGIVNVTPDSFSDGGRFLGADAAVAHALKLEAEGADILDVGGESTRPGAKVVSAQEEWARIEPVITRLVRESKVPVSVDTAKATVARAALEAGVELVNDITGGRDPALLEAVAHAQVPLVIGHLRGSPASMQDKISFADLFEEVALELAASIERARSAGVEQIIADPGIGFGKTGPQNLVLLTRAGDLAARLGVPVMLGPSRKNFLGELTSQPVGERLYATLGAVVTASLTGAAFVRVHDVRAAREALAVADAARRAASWVKLSQSDWSNK